MTINAMHELVAASFREGAELRHALARDCVKDVTAVGIAIARAVQEGNKVLFFGNGGSAADAQHLAAEFVGRFMKERAPMCALALTVDTSILTAIGNDYSFDQVFARQVHAHGRKNDVAVAISTSGKSKNVLLAVEAAREIGMQVVCFTGAGGEPLIAASDIAIVVPSAHTARVQECHIAIGHAICEVAEELFASGLSFPASSTHRVSRLDVARSLRTSERPTFAPRRAASR